MTLIEAKDLTLYYNERKPPALDSISFIIEPGRITQFLGESGSGKTTLLKCIANLHSSFIGKLTYKGRLIKDMSGKERASNIGFVSQSFDLFPHMTALKNCVHPQVHVLNKTPDDAQKHAEETLEHLGIVELSDRYPSEMSGGQKQRVSIARALCMNSKLLLLDEPTSALDPESSRKLLELLKLLNKDGVTIALSTHDMSLSKNLSGSVIYFMQKGRIVEKIDTTKQNIQETNVIKNFFAP